MPTVSGALRNNANVLTIRGVAGDYDTGAVTPEAADALLQSAGLAALIFTTPSHGAPGKGNRWRVLCPTSEAMAPEARYALLARVNGVLGGILAGESFTLSQSYYCGATTDGQPVETSLIDGRYLDKADYPDKGAIGKPGRMPSASGEVAPLDVEIALEAVRSAESYHPNLMALAGHYSRAGSKAIEIVEQLSKLMHEVPAGSRDKRWRDRLIALPGLVKDTLGYRAKDAVKKESSVFATFDGEPDWRDDFLDGCTPPVPTPKPMMLRGKPINNQCNADLYMALHVGTILPNLRVNLMTGRLEWREGEVTDRDLTAARVGLERNGLPTIGADLVREAVRTVGAELAYHPVRDWFAGLSHDSIPRLDAWLSTYAGAGESPYIRAVGRKFLIPMVARIMRPGCKADHVLVLQGRQGAGKSRLAEALAGGPTFFSDTMPSINGGRDTTQHLRGLWVIELAELAPSRKSDADDLKQFLTTRIDRYRSPYGKADEDHPRQCVFIGTTNDETFLRDPTASRRFWLVACGDTLDVEGLKRDRAQLFAEAFLAFEAKEAWWLRPDFEAAHAAPMQETAYVASPWEDRIADWLDTAPHDGFTADEGTASGKREEVRISEILDVCLALAPGQQTPNNQQQVGAILMRLGWQKLRAAKIAGGKRAVIWQRGL